MPAMLEDESETMISRPRGADVSAERAASAAEAASQAAQSIASAVERLGGWIALLASRAQHTASLAPAPQEGVPEAARFAPVEPEQGKPGQGFTQKLTRAARSVGQRVSDLSDGRLGLEVQSPKAEIKQEKKARKHLKRQAREEAKAEQFGAGVKWFPWMLGMSLGLVIGLVGVAYWQRRRLQDLWEQTSRRVQRSTGEAHQRLEAGYNQPPPIQPIMPAGSSLSTSPSVSAPTNHSNQQVNGWKEPTSL